MDSYMCYTHTIHQEAQDRVRHRTTTAPHGRVQPTLGDHPPQRRRLRLALGDRLISIGARLSRAHPRSHPTTHAGTATPITGNQPASD